MTIYIYLVMHDIAIRCLQDMGCMILGPSHFTALLAGGFLELMFEVPLIIRIFKGKGEDK